MWVRFTERFSFDLGLVILFFRRMVIGCWLVFGLAVVCGGMEEEDA